MAEQNNTGIVRYSKKSMKFELFFDGFKAGKVPLHKCDQLKWLERTIKNSPKCKQLGITNFEVQGENGEVQQTAETSDAAPGTSNLQSLKFSDPTVQSKFSVDERFGFLSTLIKMVREGISKSMILTGEGGIGKSYSVREELKDLVEDVDYQITTGFATPKGLFQFLYKNNGQFIIFDDCDSVLKDPTSMNLLKGALDSVSKRRTITWASNDSAGGDMPKKFDFTGQVIFISNIKTENLPQALLSRALFVDLNMSTEDKIKRMWTILPDVLPNVALDKREEAMQFIDDHKMKIKKLDFRTLDQVIKIRIGAPDWERLAEYMTCGG